MLNITLAYGKLPSFFFFLYFKGYANNPVCAKLIIN
jgi:hypothetical protein